jgi:hypothetical protein
MHDLIKSTDFMLHAMSAVLGGIVLRMAKSWIVGWSSRRPCTRNEPIFDWYNWIVWFWWFKLGWRGFSQWDGACDVNDRPQACDPGEIRDQDCIEVSFVSYVIIHLYIFPTFHSIHTWLPDLPRMSLGRVIPSLWLIAYMFTFVYKTSPISQSLVLPASLATYSGL